MRLLLASLLWTLSVPVSARALVQDELDRDYPGPPKKLLSDSAVSSVLVVDIDLKGVLKLNIVEGAALVPLGGDGELIRAATMRGRVVMFHNLDPGTYALRFVRIANGNARILLTMPPSPDFTVAVARGQISYLGTIVASKKIGFKPPEVQLTYDANREIAAWSAFKKKYADSFWAALADQRIGSLRPQGTAER